VDSSYCFSLFAVGIICSNNGMVLCVSVLKLLTDDCCLSSLVLVGIPRFHPWCFSLCGSHTPLRNEGVKNAE
jgi:hypothetical protein